MKRNKDRSICRVVLLTGVSAVIAQILTVRECIAQFSGNEFVIALILFNWLILGGIGNRTAHIIHFRFVPATANRLAWLSVFLAVLPVCQIYAIRLLRDVVFIHGSDVGFYPTFFFILIVMMPYGLLSGIALPYSLFALDPRRHAGGALIYIMDNIGNVVGGIVFSFILIYVATPLQSVFLVNLFLLSASVFLFQGQKTSRRLMTVGLSLAVALLVLGVLLERPSLRPPEGELAYYKESRYGRILMHKNQELLTLFEDGNPVYESQDTMLAEESVHYPLSQVDAARRILIISAQGNMMTEIRKYKPETVSVVEHNPEITQTLLRFSMISDTDKETAVIHQDARQYLQNTDQHYDAILVNLPEPETFQINRFYTDHFFSLVKRRLAEDGVLGFSVKGFESYMDEPMRQKLSCLLNTASDYFSFVTLLPGGKIFFICRSRPIDSDIPALLKKKEIPTAYVGDYFYGNVSRERIDETRSLLDSKTPKNKELSPYLIRISFDQWFAEHQTSPKWFAAGITVLGILSIITLRKHEFVLFSTGYVTMGAEILSLLAVQIFFGHIYSKIGLVITAFMAGLFPGAWLGNRFKQNSRWLLGYADAVLIALLFVFMGMLRQEEPGPSMAYFLIFGMVVSFCCGFQFPLVFSLSAHLPSGAARTFSADLTGAAFGTLLTSVLFIPGWGLLGAIWSLIGLKLSSLLIQGLTGHETYQQA